MCFLNLVRALGVKLQVGDSQAVCVRFFSPTSMLVNLEQ